MAIVGRLVFAAGMVGMIEAVHHPESLDSIHLSLRLLQICLIYINTPLVQHVLSEPRHFQVIQAAGWRGLTPLLYQHVNHFRTFRLDMSGCT